MGMLVPSVNPASTILLAPTDLFVSPCPVYINLPIGITALAFLWYFLRHVQLVRRLPDGSEDTRPPTEVVKHTFKTFDYIGW